MALVVRWFGRHDTEWHATDHKGASESPKNESWAFQHRTRLASGCFRYNAPQLFTFNDQTSPTLIPTPSFLYNLPLSNTHAHNIPPWWLSASSPGTPSWSQNPRSRQPPVAPTTPVAASEDANCAGHEDLTHDLHLNQHIMKIMKIQHMIIFARELILTIQSCPVPPFFGWYPYPYELNQKLSKNEVDDSADACWISYIHIICICVHLLIYTCSLT